MADSTLNRFVASGTTAERTAFVPDPPTPASGPDPGYMWFDTDDGLVYSWDGSAWVAPSGSGTVTNTGTLTASQLIQGNGGADVSTISNTAATALLDAMVGDSGSGGTKGLAPAPAAGDAAAGKFLKADGTWTAPSGGGGGLVLLQVYTPSGAASVDITSQISSTYNQYQIIIENVVTSANTQLLILFSTNNGASWDTSAIYDSGAAYSYPGSEGPMTGSSSAGNFPLRDGATTLATNGSYDADLLLVNPLGAKNKMLFGKVAIDDNAVGPLMLDWTGRYRNTTAVDAVQLKPVTGTITGAVYIYGIAK